MNREHVTSFHHQHDDDAAVSTLDMLHYHFPHNPLSGPTQAAPSTLPPRLLHFLILFHMTLPSHPTPTLPAILFHKPWLDPYAPRTFSPFPNHPPPLYHKPSSHPFHFPSLPSPLPPSPPSFPQSPILPHLPQTLAPPPGKPSVLSPYHPPPPTHLSPFRPSSTSRLSLSLLSPFFYSSSFSHEFSYSSPS